MAKFDLVIRNADMAIASGRRHGDIGVRNGQIVAIGEGISAGTLEIDATGRLVLPGGVDSHCHVDQVNSSGVRTADNFETATKTAALGGITTIMPFAVQRRGESPIAAVADYHRLADGKAVIDYGFHVILSDVNETVLRDDIPSLVNSGYTSFKVFMTYERVRLSERSIVDLMDVARAEDATVMIHAESHDLLQWLTERLVAQGRTAPKYMAAAHPLALERDAAHRVITMTEIVGGRVVLVHVSGAESVEQLRWAHARGIPIVAETCPQYLVLTSSCLDQPDFEGAKYCCSPPPRDAKSQASLWSALQDGVLQIYSSDHSVFLFHGSTGKRANGVDAPFNRVPMGIPGLETSLPILFSEGVSKGRLTLEQFVALTSTNAAKIYGLYPRKGTLELGSDADITIWEPNRRVTITHSELQGVADYSPFEGMTITGWPDVTISRGEIVCRGGQMVVAPGRGAFLACARGQMP